MNGHKTINQHALASCDGDAMESESMQRSMTPPPFQLFASSAEAPGGPGGNPRKKAAPPTNDHPVGPETAAQVKPTPLPAELIREVEKEVKDIDDLQICADVVIVHSPCYSAEILTIMDMVNKGELAYDEGKREILDRLAYLLTNEFKNAEGEVNSWAETNKGDGTVTNECNKGADWYHVRQGGPQYIALTDWNDATDPSQGANNYTIYREMTEVDGVGDPSKPFVQEYGMPQTSKDSDGQGKGDNRAKHTGPWIDITWFLRYLGIKKGPSKTRPKSNNERTKELYGPLKSITEDVGNDTKGEKDPKEREKEEGWDEEKRKGANTIITVKIFVPGEQYPRVKAHVTFANYLRVDVGSHPPGTRYEITKIEAEKPGEPRFSKHEMETRISQKLSETDDE